MLYLSAMVIACSGWEGSSFDLAKLIRFSVKQVGFHISFPCSFDELMKHERRNHNLHHYDLFVQIGGRVMIGGMLSCRNLR